MSDRFTCGVCKRRRPKSQREKGRARCRDRKACIEALRVYLDKQWQTANTAPHTDRGY